MKDASQPNSTLILLNMILATFIAVSIGTLLRLFGLPCWCVCGIIAVVAVIAEHILTLHPLFESFFCITPNKEH